MITFKKANPIGRTRESGFALLIAVIFSAVMLAFALLIGSLGYKQSILANSANASNIAFYVADAALECLLYADQKQKLFAYPDARPPNAQLLECGTANDVTYHPDFDSGIVSHSSSKWVVTQQISFEDTSPEYCARVTIYKPRDGTGGTTYLFSEGYSTSCSTLGKSRYAARGIHAYYR